MPVIATAAWSISSTVRAQFPNAGSGLSRYAALFKGVEVNTTFYRSHRASTYARWAASVPDGFRFALKLPRTITHERRLIGIAPLFQAFMAEIAPLGAAIGPLLCQLPPSLVFDPAVVAPALRALREETDRPIVIEVRHASWSCPEALALLAQFRIERVLADPAPVWPAETFDRPPAYIRLHGTPKIYASSYDDTAIARFRALLTPDGWCVFDNTASGAAIENALAMLAAVP